MKLEMYGATLTGTPQEVAEFMLELQRGQKATVDVTAPGKLEVGCKVAFKGKVMGQFGNIRHDSGNLIVRKIREDLPALGDDRNIQVVCRETGERDWFEPSQLEIK